MKIISILFFVLILFGCATVSKEAEVEFYKAQAQASQVDKPLFELVAKEGQEINLSGVAALRVYHPDAVQPRHIQAMPRPTHWAERVGLSLVDAALKGYAVDSVFGTITESYGAMSNIATAGIAASGNVYNGDYTGRDRFDVGGNLGDTDQSNHNHSINDSIISDGDVWQAGNDINTGTTVGNDLIGRDRIDNSGRYNSPGHDGDEWRNESPGEFINPEPEIPETPEIPEGG